METYALVGASDFNEDVFRRRVAEGAFAAVVAVDGGVASVRAAGVEPTVAIGDFDSLGYVPEGVPVQRHTPFKAASDMELGVLWAQHHGARRIEAYGALGGRLDHTIANLQLFARVSEEGAQVRLVGLDQQVAFLTGPATLELPPLPQGTVSVFAACDQADGVLEEGMRYSFDSPRLTNRSTRGLSNELIGQPARVSVGEGTLIVIFPLA